MEDIFSNNRTLILEDIKAAFDKYDSFWIKYAQKSKCRFADDCPWFLQEECFSNVFLPFNVKEYYDKCVLSYRIGNYISDLAFIDSTGKIKSPILIFADSTTEDYQKLISAGYRIIEIKSDSIVVVDKKKTAKLSQGPDIEFHNFAEWSKIPTTSALREISRFSLLDDYSATLAAPNHQSCAKLGSPVFDNSIYEIGILGKFETKSDIMRIGYVSAINAGFEFKTCNLCKHNSKKHGTIYYNSCKNKERSKYAFDKFRYPSSNDCEFFCMDEALKENVDEILKDTSIQCIKIDPNYLKKD